MAVRNIKLVFEIAGDKEYKDAIKNTNAEQKKLASELEVTKAAYATNANSMEALTAKQKNYSEIISTLEKKQELHRGGINNAREAVEKYTKQLEELTAKQAGLITQYGANSKEAEDNAKAIEKVSGFVAIAQRRENDYTAALNKTTVELSKYTVEQEKNSEYLAEAAIAADGCATSIDRYGEEVKETTPEQQNMNQSLEALAQILIAAGIQKGFNELVDLLKSTVTAAIDFESAITGVFKTVDGTPEQLEAITLGVKQMSTEIPVVTTEIAAVAEAAGQLGIATDDVLTFSRVMLDLGVSTNLSSEQAATSLAKFANITRMSADDYERLGSTIVALGNNFATTEADIVNMAMRIASTGTQVGLSVPQIIALSTALSSVGMEAEAGGSAISKIMKNIEVEVKTGGEGLKDYAAVAGLTSQEFTEAWGENAVNALGLFVSGLNDMERNGKSSIEILDEMGITEIRTSDAVLRLSNAFDVMMESQEMANQAWIENTALAAEAELRYGTTESKIQMLKNSTDLLKIAIGEQLTPVLRDFVDWGDNGVKMLTDWVQANEWVVPTITALAAALGTLVTAVTGAMIISKLAAAIMTVVNPAGLAVAAVAAVTAGIIAFAAVMPEAETKLTKLSNETKKLNDRVADTIKTVESSREAFHQASGAIETEADETEKLYERFVELTGQGELLNSEQTELKDIVEKLNERLPDLAISFDETGKAVMNYTGNIYDLIEAKRQLAIFEGVEAQYISALNTRDALKKDVDDIKTQRAEIQALIKDMEAANPYIWEDTYSMSRSATDYKRLQQDLDDINESYKRLVIQQGENRREIAESEATINGYAKTVEDTTDIIDDNTDKTEETTKATIDYTKALKLNASEVKQTEAEHKKITATHANSANTVSALTDKVNSLNNTYSKNQERINLLKKAITDETAALDKNAKGYDDAVIKIQEYQTELTNTETANIELSKEIESTKFYLDDAGKSVSGLTELLDENGNVAKDTSKATASAAAKAAKEIEKAAKETAKPVTEAIDEISKAMDALNKEYNSSYNSWYSSAIKQLDLFDTVAGKSTDTFKISSKTLNDMVAGLQTGATASLDSLINSLDKAGQESEIFVSDFVKTIRELDPNIEYTMDEIKALFGQTAEETGTTTQTMIDNMNRHTDEMQKYNSDLLRLVESGFSQGFVATLADGSDESKKALSGILDEYDNLTSEHGLNSKPVEDFVWKFNNAFDKTSTAADAMAHTMAGIQTNFDVRSKAILDNAVKLAEDVAGFTGEGFDEVKNNYIKVMAEIGESRAGVNAAIKFNEKFIPEIEKPVAAAKDVGKDIPQNISDGIEETMPVATKTATASGENIIDGIIVGVGNKENILYRKLKDIAAETLKAFNEELEIHSPSEKFIEAGEYMGEGVAIGVENTTERVTSATKELAMKSLDAFYEGVEQSKEEAHKILLELYNELTHLNKISAEQFESIFGGYDAFNSVNAGSVALMNAITSMGMDLDSATVEIKKYKDLVYGLEREVFEIQDAFGNVFKAGNMEGYKVENGNLVRNEEYWAEHERISNQLFNEYAAQKYEKVGENISRTLYQISGTMAEYQEAFLEAQEIWEIGGAAWEIYEQHIEQQGKVAVLQKEVKDQYDRMLETYMYTDAEGVKHYNEVAVKSYDELIEKLKEAREELLNTTDAYNKLTDIIKDGTVVITEAAEAIEEFIPEYENMVNIEQMEEVFSAEQIGTYIAQQLASGFDVGVRDSAGKIVSAAEYLADTIKSTTEKELGIQSPSTVFKEYGRNTAEGFLIGLRETFGEGIDTLDLNPPSLRAKIEQFNYLSALPSPNLGEYVTNSQVINNNRTSSPTIYIAQKENESQYELARKVIDMEKRMLYER